MQILVDDISNSDILQANHLIKKFDNFTAVNDVSISVKKGEIFGFLGPNGAGKTTTIRMLTTITTPTFGNITIAGYNIQKDRINARKYLGITQQHISLDKDITVRENIKHHALLQKIPRAEIEERIKEVSSLLGLEEYMDRTISSLSGGWKRKTAIVCSIIHRPKILFLDEPTAGLDTRSRHMLWDLIRMLNSNGTTIFLTTHYIEEAESLCDRVGIMNYGRIIALGTPKELCQKIGSMTVELIGDDGKIYNRYFPDRSSAKEFVQATTENYNIIRKTNLEDVFLEITGEDTAADKLVRC